MGTEIERRFLIDEIVDEHILGAGSSLRQGYLAEEDDVSTRLRIAGTTSMLTVKAGHGLVRTEVEVTIASDDAEALWSHTVGRRLTKVRYRVPLDGQARLVAEVDVYGGELTGLCTAEVEFASVDDAAAFVPPSWFGREVTGDRTWGNAALARNGRPPRS